MLMHQIKWKKGRCTRLRGKTCNPQQFVNYCRDSVNKLITVLTQKVKTNASKVAQISSDPLKIRRKKPHLLLFLCEIIPQIERSSECVGVISFVSG
jgi:hypothetical protein